MTASVSRKKMTVCSKIVFKAINIKRCLERSVKIVKWRERLFHAERIREDKQIMIL